MPSALNKVECFTLNIFGVESFTLKAFGVEFDEWLKEDSPGH